MLIAAILRRTNANEHASKLPGRQKCRKIPRKKSTQRRKLFSLEFRLFLPGIKVKEFSPPYSAVHHFKPYFFYPSNSFFLCFPSIWLRLLRSRIGLGLERFFFFSLYNHRSIQEPPYATHFTGVERTNIALFLAQLLYDFVVQYFHDARILYCQILAPP